MSYVDQRMGAGRITSIVAVAVLHALLGYVLVTGMAYNVAKKMVEDLKTFDVKEPPPPEEEPPPEQEPQPTVQPPPIVAPPPIVRLDTPAPPVQTQQVIPPVAPPVTYTAPPAPPAPVVAAPKVQAAKPKRSIAGLITSDDYPEAARRDEKQGTTRISLVIGTNGRVSSCNVSQSSGSRDLDAATCRIVTSRARFDPATDSNGSPVTDTYAASVQWKLVD
jgi:protein TonB